MNKIVCQGESFVVTDSPARTAVAAGYRRTRRRAGIDSSRSFRRQPAAFRTGKAAGAPVEVDIGTLAPGEMMVVEWRGKPVWILHRTPEMLASLENAEARLADPGSKVPQQPEYALNQQRSLKPEYLVAVGICTHLGCSPSKAFEAGDPALGADWPGGFLCPCHGSTFDFAGRVFKDKPAPTNLEIPPHSYLTDSRLLIGSDTRGHA